MERTLGNTANWITELASICRESQPGDVIVVSSDTRAELAEKALMRMLKPYVRVEVR